MATPAQVIWDKSPGVQWDDESKKTPTLLSRLNDWYTKESDIPNDPYAVGKGILPAGGSQKESPRSALMNTALMSSVPLAGAAIEAPIATGLGLAGGAVGGKVGRFAGEALGAPEIGEDVGGLMGGLVSGIGGSKGSRMARNTIGRAMFEPIGDPLTPSKSPTGSGTEYAFKPGARTATRIAGGAVGALPGILKGNPVEAFYGGGSGAALAPSMMESMFKPKPTPVYPGAQLPLAEDFYAERGAEVNAANSLATRFDKMQAKNAAAQAKIPDWETPTHDVFELGSPEYPGQTSNVPSRVAPQYRGDPFAPPAGTPETALNPYTRPVTSGQEPLVVTPDEAASLDQLQSIAAQRARERGMQYAGGVRTAGKNKVANRLFPSRIE